MRLAKGGIVASVRGVVVTVFAMALGFTVFWFLAPRSQSFGMFERIDNGATFRLAFSFATTIVGVVLGSIYRELRDLQSQGIKKIPDLKIFFTDMTRSVDLWIGLAGAPIVYALLLKTSDGMSLEGLTAIALQNGFCCFLIVNGVVGRVTAQQATLAGDVAKEPDPTK